MSTAIGMIETLGFIGSTEAADAMTKTANVTIEKYETIGNGYTTTIVRGDMGAVSAAIEAGQAAAQRVGEKVISVHIIPNLDPEVAKIIFKK
ncbi:MAG: ethanolamine utilization protein EutM [Candidatus Latescibacterota bacterium]|jgi:ethanolamine utilization protein EutM